MRKKERIVFSVVEKKKTKQKMCVAVVFLIPLQYSIMLKLKVKTGTIDLLVSNTGQ